MSHEPTMPEDIVERAAAVLRETPVPPGPPATVVENTLAQLRALAEASCALPASDNMGTMPMPHRWVTRWRIAAGLLVLVGVSAAILWVMAASSRTAFADVLATVRRVRSVRFTQQWTDPAGTAASAEILLVDPGQMRVEHTAGPGIGSVAIMNLGHRRGIALLPGKYAMELSLNDDARSRKRLKDFEDRNLLDHFRLWRESDATRTGTVAIAGRTAVEFRITRPEQDVTLWVDPDTRLPIRVVMREPTSGGAVNQLVFENFRWNESYDQTALSLAPPPGYVLERYKFDLAEPCEADLIETLRAFAELRGGTFPDDLSLMGILMGAHKIAATRPAAQQSVQSQHVTRAMAIGRGLLFVGDVELGADWRYAGMSVKINTPDRPILWYRPARSDRYRVIYADLSTRDVASDALPKADSIPITRSTDRKSRIQLP